MPMLGCVSQSNRHNCFVLLCLLNLSILKVYIQRLNVLKFAFELRPKKCVAAQWNFKKVFFERSTIAKSGPNQNDRSR